MQISRNLSFEKGGGESSEVKITTTNDENYDYLPFGHLNKNSFSDVSQWVQPENIASPQVLESRSISKTCSLRFVLKFLSLLKSMIDKDHFKAARSGPSSPWADTVHQPTRGRCEKTISLWSNANYYQVNYHCFKWFTIPLEAEIFLLSELSSISNSYLSSSSSIKKHQKVGSSVTIFLHFQKCDSCDILPPAPAQFADSSPEEMNKVLIWPNDKTL